MCPSTCTSGVSGEFAAISAAEPASLDRYERLRPELSPTVLVSTAAEGASEIM